MQLQETQYTLDKMETYFPTIISYWKQMLHLVNIV
jgi:hypothetical protein